MSRGFGSTVGAGTGDLLTLTNSFVQPAFYSFSGWINPLSGGATNRGRIYETNIAGSLPAFNYNAAANAMAWSYGYSSANGIWTFTPPTVATGWHHVSITYDSTNILNAPTVYFDGIATSVSVNTPPLGSILTTSNLFYCGNRQSLDRNWDGYLAHFATWNVLLSPPEIALLAGGFTPALIRPESQLFYAPLDGINNPEIELKNGLIAALSGTKFGSSIPPDYPWRHKYLGTRDISVGSFTGSLGLTQPAQTIVITTAELFTITSALTQPAPTIVITAAEKFTVSSFALTQPAQSINITDSIALTCTIALHQPVQSIAISSSELFVCTSLSLTQEPNSISILGASDSITRWRLQGPTAIVPRRRLPPTLVKIRTNDPELGN